MRLRWPRRRDPLENLEERVADVLAGRIERLEQAAQAADLVRARGLTLTEDEKWALVYWVRDGGDPPWGKA